MYLLIGKQYFLGTKIPLLCMDYIFPQKYLTGSVLWSEQVFSV